MKCEDIFALLKKKKIGPDPSTNPLCLFSFGIKVIENCFDAARALPSQVRAEAAALRHERAALLSASGSQPREARALPSQPAPSVVSRVRADGSSSRSNTSGGGGPLRPGDSVRMLIDSSEASFAGCPGSRLAFSAEYELTVNEVRGAFFDSTRWTSLRDPRAAAERM